MKRGTPSTSRPTGSPTKQAKQSHPKPTDDIDQTDLTAFQNDLNRVRAVVKARDELDSPGKFCFN